MKVECPRCKTQVEAAAGDNLSCPTCGFSAEVPAPEGGMPAAQSTQMPAQPTASGSWTSTGGTVVHEANKQPSKAMAIAALVTGVVGFLTGFLMIGILLDFVALVLGIVVLVQAKKRPDQVGGKGMAIGGLVAGALGLLFMVLLLTIGVQLAVEACREDPSQPNCDQILDTYGARAADGPLDGALGALDMGVVNQWMAPRLGLT